MATRILLSAFEIGGFRLEVAGELLGTTFAAYVLLVAIGRLLKWRFGTRLGAVYQLFAFTLAPCLSAAVLGVDLPARREFAAAAALLGSLVTGRLIDRFFWRWFFEDRRRSAIPKLIREMTTGLLLLAAVLLVLEYGYGKHVPGLLAASGLAGIILGFGLQDSLGNTIAGFALQFGRPFAVGDWLLIDGRHVQAVEINWRSTRFITNDDIQLDVPNQHLVRQTLVNFHGGNSRHAMRLEVGVEYDIPPNKVKDILARAASAAGNICAEPAPNVFLKEFGESAVIYEVRFWLDDHRLYNQAADEVRTNVWYALHRQRIRIPYPVRHLQIERPHKPKRDAPLTSDEQRMLVTRELLHAQPVFRSLGEEHLKKLVGRSSVHHYGRGELMIREGADGSSMFVLVSGEARVSVLRDGRLTPIASLRGGDCFGEMSLLTGEKRSASVQAVSDCEVMEITKRIFSEIVSLDPGLLPALSELLATRRMQTEGIMQAAAQQPAILAATEEEYRAGFLHTLRSFFEL